MLKEKSRNISKKIFPILNKCECCGEKENLERHHFDYNKPEIIIIFCPKCHKNWHKNNKTINGEDRTTGKYKIIAILMDNKLYKQLKGYADRNDESIVSVSARRAIKKFLEEQVETYKIANAPKFTKKSILK